MRTSFSRAVAALGFLLACASAQAQTTLDVEGDTWTDSASGRLDTNAGTATVLALAATRTILLQFPVSAIAQSGAGEATLQLTIARVKRNPNTLEMRVVQGAWNQNVVTARTLPAISAQPFYIATLSGLKDGGRLTVDVTAVVAAWRANPSTNFGIAITSRTGPSNLEFDAIGNTTSAKLILGGRAVARNDVTVGATGNYQDVAVAARNAHSGDTWCVNPTAAAPCKLRVSEGHHFVQETIQLPAYVDLIGAEKGSTTITGLPSVTRLIDSVGSKISDVTLVSAGDAVIQTDPYTAPLRLERVSIRASSRALTSGSPRNVDIVDSELVARGSIVQAAVFYRATGAGRLTITRSRIVALGTSSAIATWVDSLSAVASSGVVIEDSSLYANAPYAEGLHLANLGTSASGVISRSEIFANSSDGRADAVASGEGVRSIDIVSSRLVASGTANGVSTSALRASTGAVLTVDDSTLDATDHGIFAMAGMARITVMRSQITAGSIGIGANNANATVDSGTSVLAPIAIYGPSLQATLTDVMLGGTATSGSGTRVCQRVFNERGQQMGANCTAPAP